MRMGDAGQQRDAAPEPGTASCSTAAQSQRMEAAVNDPVPQCSSDTEGSGFSESLEEHCFASGLVAVGGASRWPEERAELAWRYEWLRTQIAALSNDVLDIDEELLRIRTRKRASPMLYCEPGEGACARTVGVKVEARPRQRFVKNLAPQTSRPAPRTRTETYDTAHDVLCYDIPREPIHKVPKNRLQRPLYYGVEHGCCRKKGTIRAGVVRRPAGAARVYHERPTPVRAQPHLQQQHDGAAPRIASPPTARKQKTAAPRSRPAKAEPATPHSARGTRRGGDFVLADMIITSPVSTKIQTYQVKEIRTPGWKTLDSDKADPFSSPDADGEIPNPTSNAQLETWFVDQHRELEQKERAARCAVETSTRRRRRSVEDASDHPPADTGGAGGRTVRFEEDQEGSVPTESTAIPEASYALPPLQQLGRHGSVLPGGRGNWEARDPDAFMAAPVHSGDEELEGGAHDYDAPERAGEAARVHADEAKMRGGAVAPAHVDQGAASTEVAMDAVGSNTHHPQGTTTGGRTRQHESKQGAEANEMTASRPC